MTFHSRQPNCVGRVSRKADAGAFKFTSQIAPPICTTPFTKCEKSDAIIFNPQCKRTVVCYRFKPRHAVPLDFTRFLRLANRSPKLARSPARWSRNDRDTTGKTSGEMSRTRPRSLPTMASQRHRRSRWTNREMIRKQLTTHRICLRNSHATTKATSRKMTHLNLTVTSNHDIQKL
jgi:hypothetical protein